MRWAGKFTKFLPNLAGIKELKHTHHSRHGTYLPLPGLAIFQVTDLLISSSRFY